MGAIMDDLAVAFAMQADGDNLTYEEGIARAESLCDEIMWAAEERRSYAVIEEPDED